MNTKRRKDQPTKEPKPQGAKAQMDVIDEHMNEPIKGVDMAPSDDTFDVHNVLLDETSGRPIVYDFNNGTSTIRFPYIDVIMLDGTSYTKEKLYASWKEMVGKEITYRGRKHKVIDTRLIAGFIFVDVK